MELPPHRPNARPDPQQDPNGMIMCRYFVFAMSSVQQTGLIKAVSNGFRTSSGAACVMASRCVRTVSTV